MWCCIKWGLWYWLGYASAACQDTDITSYLYHINFYHMNFYVTGMHVTHRHFTILAHRIK